MQWKIISFFASANYTRPIKPYPSLFYRQASCSFSAHHINPSQAHNNKPHRKIVHQPLQLVTRNKRSKFKQQSLPRNTSDKRLQPKINNMPLSGVKTLKLSPFMFSEADSPAIFIFCRAIDEYQANPSYDVLLIRMGEIDSPHETIDKEDQALSDNLLSKLLFAKKPIAIALHGTIDKTGFEIAMACTWRTAHPNTHFKLTNPASDGQINDLIIRKMARIVGDKITSEWIEKNTIFDSKAALQLGLIDQIQDGEPLDAGLVFVVKAMKSSSYARPNDLDLHYFSC